MALDFRNPKSESSPFISTFSKIPLSLTICYSSNVFPSDITKISSTSLDCNTLTASAIEEFSSAVTNLSINIL